MKIELPHKFQNGDLVQHKTQPRNPFCVVGLVLEFDGTPAQGSEPCVGYRVTRANFGPSSTALTKTDILWETELEAYKGWSESNMPPGEDAAAPV